MERHGHLQLEQEVRTKLLAMSAATIDRALRDIRRQAGTATRRRSARSAAIRRSVPVRTFDDWDDPPPGFVEADLVAHSGPVTRGSFVQWLRCERRPRLNLLSSTANPSSDRERLVLIELVASI